MGCCSVKAIPVSRGRHHQAAEWQELPESAILPRPSGRVSGTLGAPEKLPLARGSARHDSPPSDPEWLDPAASLLGVDLRRPVLLRASAAAPLASLSPSLRELSLEQELLSSARGTVCIVCRGQGALAFSAAAAGGILAKKSDAKSPKRVELLGDVEEVEELLHDFRKRKPLEDAAESSRHGDEALTVTPGSREDAAKLHGCCTSSSGSGEHAAEAGGEADAAVAAITVILREDSGEGAVAGRGAQSADRGADDMASEYTAFESVAFGLPGRAERARRQGDSEAEASLLLRLSIFRRCSALGNRSTKLAGLLVRRSVYMGAAAPLQEGCARQGSGVGLCRSEGASEEPSVQPPLSVCQSLLSASTAWQQEDRPMLRAFSFSEGFSEAVLGEIHELVQRAGPTLAARCVEQPWLEIARGWSARQLGDVSSSRPEVPAKGGTAWRQPPESPPPELDLCGSPASPRRGPQRLSHHPSEAPLYRSAEASATEREPPTLAIRPASCSLPVREATRALSAGAVSLTLDADDEDEGEEPRTVTADGTGSQTRRSSGSGSCSRLTSAATGADSLRPRRPRTWLVEYSDEGEGGVWEALDRRLCRGLDLALRQGRTAQALLESWPLGGAWSVADFSAMTITTRQGRADRETYRTLVRLGRHGEMPDPEESDDDDSVGATDSEHEPRAAAWLFSTSVAGSEDGWGLLDEAATEILEDVWAWDSACVVLLHGPVHNYKVDLQAMTNTNTSTGEVRRVHRLLSTNSPSPPPCWGGRSSCRGDGSAGPGCCWMCCGVGRTSKWFSSFEAPTAEDSEDPQGECLVCKSRRPAFRLSAECHHVFCRACVGDALEDMLRSTPPGQVPQCPGCSDSKAGSVGRLSNLPSLTMFLEDRGISTPSLRYGTVSAKGSVDIMVKCSNDSRVEEARFLEVAAASACAAHTCAGASDFDGGDVGELRFFCPSCRRALVAPECICAAVPDEPPFVRLGHCTCGASVCLCCFEEVLEPTNHVCATSRRLLAGFHNELRRQSILATEVIPVKECPVCHLLVPRSEAKLDSVMCGSSTGSLRESLHSGGCGLIFNWWTLQAGTSDGGWTDVDQQRLKGRPVTARQIPHHGKCKRASCQFYRTVDGLGFGVVPMFTGRSQQCESGGDGEYCCAGCKDDGPHSEYCHRVQFQTPDQLKQREAWSLGLSCRIPTAQARLRIAGILDASRLPMQPLKPFRARRVRLAFFPHSGGIEELRTRTMGNVLASATKLKSRDDAMAIASSNTMSRDSDASSDDSDSDVDEESRFHLQFVTKGNLLLFPAEGLQSLSSRRSAGELRFGCRGLSGREGFAIFEFDGPEEVVGFKTDSGPQRCFAVHHSEDGRAWAPVLRSDLDAP